MRFPVANKIHHSAFFTTPVSCGGFPTDELFKVECSLNDATRQERDRELRHAVDTNGRDREFRWDWRRNMWASAAAAAGYFHSESTCGLGRASGLRNWPCKFPRRRTATDSLSRFGGCSRRSVSRKPDLNSTTYSATEKRRLVSCRFFIANRRPIQFLTISLRVGTHVTHFQQFQVEILLLH